MRLELSLNLVSPGAGLDGGGGGGGSTDKLSTEVQSVIDPGGYARTLSRRRPYETRDQRAMFWLFPAVSWALLCC